MLFTLAKGCAYNGIIDKAAQLFRAPEGGAFRHSSYKDIFKASLSRIRPEKALILKSELLTPYISASWFDEVKLEVEREFYIKYLHHLKKPLTK